MPKESTVIMYGRKIAGLLLGKMLAPVLFMILLPLTLSSPSAENWLLEFSMVTAMTAAISFGAAAAVRRVIPSVRNRFFFGILMLLCGIGSETEILEMFGLCLLSISVVLLEKGKLTAAALGLAVTSCFFAPPLICLLLPISIWLYRKKEPEVKILNTTVPASALVVFCISAVVFFILHIIFIVCIVGDKFSLLTLEGLSIPLCVIKPVLMICCCIALQLLSQSGQNCLANDRTFLAFCCILYVGGILFCSFSLKYIALLLVCYQVFQKFVLHLRDFKGVPKEADLAVFRKTVLMLFLFFVFLYSWNCDDSYHSFVMAEHLIHGKGLVYSAGYRTTASTCPLLTLLQAGVLAIVRLPEICTLLIGLGFAGFAGYIVIFRFCKSRFSIVFSALVMTCSYCFMCFTTSGLENCLLYCFGAALLDLFYHNENLNRKQLFGMALLMSLLAMARTDSVLVFIPVAVYAYLFRTKVKFYQRVVIGFAGLLPFAGWTLFSLLYYGFPFPNTFYAKVYTGFPASDYLIRGAVYHGASWLYDPLLLLIPAAFIFLAFRLKDRTALVSAAGIVVYCIYVFKIGGDFMLGRHLTLQYFCSLCGIIYLTAVHDLCNVLTFRSVKISRKVLSAAAVCTIFFGGAVWHDTVCQNLNRNVMNIYNAYHTYCNAVDERFGYQANRYNIIHSLVCGLLGRPSYFENLMNFSVERIRERYLTDESIRGICTECDKAMMCGYSAYRLSQEGDYYLTDDIALPDPLLSHLHAEYEPLWRIGHMERAIPAGYEESLAKGTNLIEDPSLHEYYDKLLLIMTGELFDRERIQTIIDLNTGKYDHLLEEYESRKATEQTA